MSCQTITPREDFQRKLEDMNPEAASAIKRMVEAEQLLKKKRGPLHPSTEEEIMQAAEVRQEAENCTMHHDREAGYRSGSVEQCHQLHVFMKLYGTVWQYMFCCKIWSDTDIERCVCLHACQSWAIVCHLWQRVAM